MREIYDWPLWSVHILGVEPSIQLLAFLVGVDLASISIPTEVPSLIKRRIILRGRAIEPMFKYSEIANDPLFLEVVAEASKKRTKYSGTGSPYLYPARKDPRELLEASRFPYESEAAHLHSIGRHKDAQELLTLAPQLSGDQDWEQLQHLAIEDLFIQLVEYRAGFDRPAVITASDLARREHETLEVSGLIASLKEKFSARGLHKQVAILGEMKRAWEDTVDAESLFGVIALKRSGRKHSDTVRAAAVYFAKINERLFGQHMPSNVAKSVELSLPGSKLTKSDAEAIIRGDMQDF